MSISAQGAVWSIAPQTDKLGDVALDVAASNWYKYRVATITGGAMQDQQVLPLEIGGPMTPTGGYKSGAYFMQEVDIIPRLEDDIGLLFAATIGSASSVADKKYNASGWVTNTGAKGHLFVYDTTDNAHLKWLATRRRIPGVDSDHVSGEVAQDCRVSGLRLNIPGAGIITGRLGVQGRIPTEPLAADVNAWTYVNSYENSNSIAHAGTGSLKVGSTTPKITGLTIDFINSLTRPQDEFIVGSYYPDDVACMTRAVRLRASVKWEDDALYRLLYTSGGVDWSSLPYFSVTSGIVKGFFFEAKSPANMPALSVPYALRVMANNVMLSCDPSSLRLRAGSIIEYMINIDVLDNEDGSNYIEVALDNKVASYVWS